MISTLKVLANNLNTESLYLLIISSNTVGFVSTNNERGYERDC